MLIACFCCFSLLRFRNAKPICLTIMAYFFAPFLPSSHRKKNVKPKLFLLKQTFKSTKITPLFTLFLGRNNCLLFYRKIEFLCCELHMYVLIHVHSQLRGECFLILVYHFLMQFSYVVSKKICKFAPYYI